MKARSKTGSKHNLKISFTKNKFKKNCESCLLFLLYTSHIASLIFRIHEIFIIIFISVLVTHIK